MLSRDHENGHSQWAHRVACKSHQRHSDGPALCPTHPQLQEREGVVSGKFSSGVSPIRRLGPVQGPPPFWVGTPLPSLYLQTLPSSLLSSFLSLLYQNVFIGAVIDLLQDRGILLQKRLLELARPQHFDEYYDRYLRVSPWDEVEFRLKQVLEGGNRIIPPLAGGYECRNDIWD
ncbi:hypothetical protein LIER_26817 [Lithospermum erythrorhizon]|uniref:Uncharacterized protein n=1 Tax=Lithospermum erythrorhizon TaxID=34254 RepID=A0AAV3RA00_LITER